YVRQMKEQRDRYSDPTPFEFAHVRSVAELRGLTAEEAAAHWLESRDPSWQIRLQFASAGCPVPKDAETASSPTRRLIGIVAEDDTLSYALFRELRDDHDAPDFQGGDLFVMQLKQRRGRWMVVPRGDLLPDVGTVDTEDCRRGEQ